MPRRRLLLAAPAILVAPAVRAQGAWPSRPVRILNPYAPGGTSDIVIRYLAAGMERAFGQPFIVENRPGAGGAVGTAAAAAAAPDGHTLLITNTGPLAVSVSMTPAPNYDPQRSFSYVTLFGGAPILCAVKGDGPIRSMADYKAAAAVRRDAVTFGSSGVGSVGHLAGMLWAQEAGVELLHVPFRGAADAQQSVLGSNTVSLWDTLAAHAGGVRGGGIRGLAVTSETRVGAVPEVPTIVEAGFPGAVASNWFLLAGPAGLPAEIVERLRQHLAAAMAEPAARERWAGIGMVSLGSPTPAEIAGFVAREAARWAPVVRASATG
ncbi:tripartite tricarboxylate transporter substrate binding protein [Roseomonas eburnea]|uniref:Tripartite tricarboxylate transporter substrate binding protein n=1 Tax=Neoroseomonas eburnea TaxID=1346889 RepID=A0A9X9X853_9PROT|nr:tripartite tricarboxylate transporter substrate binding protein [Neoroseomonas eburnea]MBR0679889.1 tripartite tricarboxylate transporter substrate binding protein [Neoroseomonas eburnea]